MFDMAMPRVEICWIQGFKASQNDIDESENPYPKHSVQAHYWQEGWWEGLLSEGQVRVMA